MSGYSVQARALGVAGDGTRPPDRGGAAMGAIPEDEDVDSVDLSLLRIQRENRSNDDDVRSIDIVHAGSTAEKEILRDLIAFEQAKQRQKQERAAKQRRILPAEKAVAAAAGARGGQQPNEVPAPPKASWPLRQAAPMVLNLEDLTESTPEVLEMELGRLSLDELLDLDASVSTRLTTNERARYNGNDPGDIKRAVTLR